MSARAGGARIGWRGLAARGLALVVGIAVCLVAGEAAVRLAFGSRGFYDLEMRRYFQLLTSETDMEGVGHWHEAGARAEIYGVEIATNRHGMRSPEVEPEAGPGATRIAVLGDSLTLGWGVPEPETYARRLESALRASAPAGRRFEVLNFGIVDFNASQASALYRQLARRFRPKHVVFGFFLNDAEPIRETAPASAQPSSHLFVFVASRLFRLRSAFDPEHSYRGHYQRLYEEGSPGWEATRVAIADLAQATRRDGARLTVLLQPELHELAPEENPFASEYAKVADEARRHGARVLDLWPFFQGREPESLWVSREDAHPNASAHAITAAALQDHLFGLYPAWSSEYDPAVTARAEAGGAP